MSKIRVMPQGDTTPPGDSQAWRDAPLSGGRRSASLKCHRPLATFPLRLAPGRLAGATEKEDDVLSFDVDAATAADTGMHMMGHPVTEETGVSLASLILSTLEDSKAEDIVQIDLRGKSAMADLMVICSGRSSRQVAAISDRLVDTLKQELGVRCTVEGKEAGDWVLIDAGDVIVHVFRPEVREFYQLEKMWMTPATAASRA